MLLKVFDLILAYTGQDNKKLVFHIQLILIDIKYKVFDLALFQHIFRFFMNIDWTFISFKVQWQITTPWILFKFLTLAPFHSQLCLWPSGYGHRLRITRLSLLWVESCQGHWILSCEEAIQPGYRMLVVLLWCPIVPDIMQRCTLHQ